MMRLISAPGEASPGRASSVSFHRGAFCGTATISIAGKVVATYHRSTIRSITSIGSGSGALRFASRVQDCRPAHLRSLPRPSSCQSHAKS